MTMKRANSKPPSTPDHSDDLKRLKRIKGQIEGIERMIQEHRYCPEIMNQIQAAVSAMNAMKRNMLERHLRHCVAMTFTSNDSGAREAKIGELLDLVTRN